MKKIKVYLLFPCDVQGHISFCFFPKFARWKLDNLCSLPKVTPLDILGFCSITLGYILIPLPTDNSANQSGKKCSVHLICKQITRKGIMIFLFPVKEVGQNGEKSKTSVCQALALPSNMTRPLLLQANMYNNVNVRHYLHYT